VGAGITVTVDNTAPTGTISINGGAIYSTSADVDLTLTASSDVVQMQFSNDNSIWSTPENYATSKAWKLSIGDGLKTVYVRYKDGVGNWSTTEIKDTLTLDTTESTGSIVINSGDIYTTSTNVTLMVSASDTSGITQMQFSTDNSSWNGWEAYSPTKDWALTPGDGLKAVYVRFKDTAGNISQSYFDNIILDTTPPTGSITVNSGATYTNSSSITLSISCTDAGSDCSQMQLGSDNVAWSDPETYATVKSLSLDSANGLKTVYVRFKDNAENWSTAEITDTITLDTTPPSVVSPTTPASGATGVLLDAVISITFSEDMDSSTITPATVLLKDNGNIVYTSLSYNSSTKTITLTPSAPLSEYTTYTVSVTTGVRDAVSNPMASAYTFSFKTTDSTKPTSTILSPSAGSLVGNASTYIISGISSDTGSGISKVEVSTDGGSTWSVATGTTSWTYSWTLPADGTYTIKTRATDAAGNVGDGGTGVTVTVDNTPPVTTATPAGGTYTTAQSVTLAADETATIYYTTDGTTPTTASGKYSVPIYIATNTTLKFFAVDLAGNIEGIKTEIYNLDVTPPTTTASVATGLYNSDISVTLSCNDNSGSGCSKTYYCLGTNCNPATEYTGTAIGITESTTLIFFSTDLNNNKESPGSVVYTIDKTAPVGSIAINNDATYTKDLDVSLTIPASDVGSGVVKMRFSADGASWKGWEDYAESKIYRLNSGDGIKAVYVQFRDAAGNISETYSDSIILDTTAPASGTTPTISLDRGVTIAGQIYYSYSKIVASWTSLSDTAAGLKEYRIAIGTSSGGTDILNWTGTGTTASYTSGDISSDYFGKTLYLSTKAIDNLGNEGTISPMQFIYTPADINSKSGQGDGRVDGFDLGKLGIAFGSSTGGVADINRDGKVDGNDLIILGTNFGKVKP
jgi:hypothetical protein